MNERKQLQSFAVCKKLKISAEVEQPGACSVFWKFDVSESFIQYWKEKNYVFLQSNGQWWGILMGKKQNFQRQKKIFLFL